MSSGFGGFLVSATIVTSGLTGIWAWPAVQDGGIQALTTQASDLYRRADLRLRPAISAFQSPVVQSPTESSGEPVTIATAIAVSLPSPEPVEIKPLQTGVSAPIVPDRCNAPEARYDASVIGDRIQLRIFETSTLAADTTSGGSMSPTDIVFERLDLSGTYEVGDSGAVSLPAIGRVDVAGQTLSCIEAIVAHAAFKRMRTQNTITAAFTTRPPILMRGAVRAPGSYTYSSGLTVERVLAQAGAIDERDPMEEVRRIALESRRSELGKTRISLSLERMRIEAALNDQDVFPEDDKAIRIALDLLGEDRVTTERRALAAEIEAERMRQIRTEAMLNDMTIRIETARQQQEVAKSQMDYYVARREQKTEMLQKGLISASGLDDTAMRAMDAERIFLEKHDLLLRLEAELRLAQHDAELVKADRIKTLTAELRGLSARSDAVDREFHTVLAELDLFKNDGIGFAVTIDRPTDENETRTISANLNTLVRPGDLVTVAARTADEDDEDALTNASAARDRPVFIQSAYTR
ncbi:MAG: polysaccharide biosynthesis/export family protein [Jannaschia helgolandensis]